MDSALYSWKYVARLKDGDVSSRRKSGDKSTVLVGSE